MSTRRHSGPSGDRCGRQHLKVVPDIHHGIFLDLNGEKCGESPLSNLSREALQGAELWPHGDADG